MGRFFFVTYSQSGAGRVAVSCAVRKDPSTTERFLSLAIRSVVLAATAITAFSQVYAQTAVIDREYAIKAAFLYQFSKYIEWPAAAFTNPDGAFVIGVYKTNPFDATLQKVADTKKVGDRPIVIEVVTKPKQSRNCHILFVSDAVAAEERKRVIKATRDVAVLVVGESEAFVQQGGDSQFFLEDNKVRFAFQSQSDDQRGLKISSKLLTLARPVPGLPQDDSNR